jgi:hypothetical protein
MEHVLEELGRKLLKKPAASPKIIYDEASRGFRSAPVRRIIFRGIRKIQRDAALRMRSDAQIWMLEVLSPDSAR